MAWDPLTYADMSVACDLGVTNFNPTSRTAFAQALDDREPDSPLSLCETTKHISYHLYSFENYIVLYKYRENNPKKLLFQACISMNYKVIQLSLFVFECVSVY